MATIASLELHSPTHPGQATPELEHDRAALEAALR
jgi:hypothetical protein